MQRATTALRVDDLQPGHTDPPATATAPATETSPAPASTSESPPPGAEQTTPLAPGNTGTRVWTAVIAISETLSEEEMQAAAEQMQQRLASDVFGADDTVRVTPSARTALGRRLLAGGADGTVFHITVVPLNPDAARLRQLSAVALHEAQHGLVSAGYTPTIVSSEIEGSAPGTPAPPRDADAERHTSAPLLAALAVIAAVVAYVLFNGAGTNAAAPPRISEEERAFLRRYANSGTPDPKQEFY
jgi:hypothetical protein